MIVGRVLRWRRRCTALCEKTGNMPKLLLQEGNLSKPGRSGTANTTAEIRVRFCSQLLLKDLGCGQPAINYSPGPRHSELSELPYCPLFGNTASSEAEQEAVLKNQPLTQLVTHTHTHTDRCFSTTSPTPSNLLLLCGTECNSPTQP